MACLRSAVSLQFTVTATGATGIIDFESEGCKSSTTYELRNHPP